MPTLEHVTLSLTEEESAALQSAMDSGAYTSTNAILEEALREWQEAHGYHPSQVHMLRQAWDEGIASGTAGVFDFDEALLRAREQLQDRTSKPHAA